MKTNITTDNYEAYLLDYMEGNLSPEGAAQLQAFVAAQGLDWDELTAPLPYLEAPQSAYEGKEKLKKGAALVPLYVKIASAAAAAGLLLTVTLWPEKSMPKMEPIVQLQPIEVSHINATESWALLPRRATENMNPLPRTSHRKDDMLREATNQKSAASVRETTPLLAELPARNATSLQTDLPLSVSDEPDFDLVAYRMNTNLAFAPINEYAFDDYEDDERNLTLIGRGLLWLTNGRHDSFASLIGAGVRKAKQDLTEAATDMALAAYQRAEGGLEETRSRWEEKRGE